MRHQHFDRSCRLTTPADYRRVFAKATRHRDSCFTVLHRPNNGQQARLGLAIAKKHVRRAVDRHRIKRAVRESFRRHRELLPAVDLVVLANPRTAGLEAARLRASLQDHWAKVGRSPAAGHSEPAS